uniref:NADH dehydrogenase subunit 2 n=1 Tax=Perotrochus quoyanus TaxID=160002 RepID=UPI001E7FFA1B|nr:NADH dehydrogenase subunit 2 [Perotrochus quoyanus]UDL72151.1 NADH dehydrogenase subunit 2 [Perotrochus quoyanus]
MFMVMPYGFLFISVMLFGTIFSLSANHWLGIWAGLEINLMGFLPLMIYRGMISETESGIKYFIIQAAGSGLLMMGSLLCFGYSFNWEILGSMNTELMVTGAIFLISGLLLKLGSFPFYFWLPSVMAGLSWMGCLLLATWQKIAPIFLLSSVIQSWETSSIKNIALGLAVGGGIIGGLGGVNQTQIRSLLAYSSISHIGWMLFCMLSSEIALKIYFSVYVLISICLFFSLWGLESSLFSQSESSSLNKVSLRFSVMVLLLSLAGMPPMLGFFSKWIALVSGMNSFFYIPAIILLISSVISLLYYLGLSFSMFFSTGKNLNLNTMKYKEKDQSYSVSSNMVVVLILMLIINMSGGVFIMSDSYIQNFF